MYKRQVPEPPKALKGFKRITLDPGKSKHVRFSLNRRAFSYWSTKAHGWKVVRGCGQVLVGSSSAKTPLRAPIGPRGPCKG